MPKTLSAERAARESEIKRQHNRSIKTAAKSYLSKAEDVIASADVEKAKLAVKQAITKIDKAVNANILHPNTGAHRKSNLMRKFNKAFSAQALPAKAKQPAKKPVTRRRTTKKTSEAKTEK